MKNELSPRGQIGNYRRKVALSSISHFWKITMREFQKKLINLYAFFISFEYIYVVFFGFDSIWKPYRIIAVIIIFLLVVRGRIRFDLYDKWFLLIFFLGVALSLLTVFGGDGSISTTVDAFELISLSFLVGLALKNTEMNRVELNKTLSFFMVGIVGNVVMVYYQYYFNYSYRLSGFYKDPAILGVSIALLIFYLLTKIASSGIRGIRKALLMLVIPALFFSLLLTGSRTAVVVLFLGLVMYGSLSKFKHVVLYMGSVILVAFSFSFVNLEKISRLLDRFTLDSFSTGAGRVDIWRAALLLFEEKPFIGIGMGQYVNYSREYASKLDYVFNDVVLHYDLSLHNNYLSMIIEYGVIGFLVFVLINYRLLKISYRDLRYAKQKEFSIFILVLVVSVLAQGMFQGTLIYPSYFFIIALVVSYHRQTFSELQLNSHSRKVLERAPVSK